MRRPLKLLLVLAVLAIGVRAALPELLERYVDRVLDRSDDYEGRLDDVDVALWRGAYSIEGLRLDHERKRELRPLISADRLELSIEWRALIHGAFVGEVDAHGVVYNVVAAPPSDDDALAQTGDDPDLAARLSELFPLSIDRLEVHGGEIHYRDPHRRPVVDVPLTGVRLLATNWSNVRDAERRRFGRAWLRARAFESARLGVSLEADPLASPPEFALAAVGEGIDLTRLNDFLQAYAGFDAERGRLSVYLEVEASGGRFDGYVKPIVEDLDVVGGDEGDVLDRIWEGVVAVVAEVFENQFSGRQATRIPIEGEWGGASPDLLAAIGNVLYNAFIQSLAPRLERSGRLEREAERLEDAPE